MLPPALGGLSRSHRYAPPIEGGRQGGNILFCYRRAGRFHLFLAVVSPCVVSPAVSVRFLSLGLLSCYS